MTGEEAIEALEAGKTITRPEWTKRTIKDGKSGLKKIGGKYLGLMSCSQWPEEKILKINDWELIKEETIAVAEKPKEEEYVYKRKSLLNWQKE